MSVSGHVQGVSYRQRTGNNGNVVHEILNDFQNEPVLGNGHALGNGWLRILTFDPTQNQIRVESLTVEDGNCAIFANCQSDAVPELQPGNEPDHDQTQPTELHHRSPLADDAAGLRVQGQRSPVQGSHGPRAAPGTTLRSRNRDGPERQLRDGLGRRQRRQRRRADPRARLRPGRQRPLFADHGEQRCGGPAEAPRRRDRRLRPLRRGVGRRPGRRRLLRDLRARIQCQRQRALCGAHGEHRVDAASKRGRP